MLGTENGIIQVSSRKRDFTREFKIAVLEHLDRGGTVQECARDFKITRAELKRIIHGRIQPPEGPGRLGGMAGAINELALRNRLYERAVEAVEDSLDPIERVVNKSQLLQGPKGLSHLPTAVNHLRNRGQNAIKVLEGIGDFRRGGDDVPREGPRQPLFNLPPGTHVAVKLDITTSNEGEENARISDGRDSEAGPAAEIRAEAVAPPIQEGEPPGGDRSDSGFQPAEG